MTPEEALAFVREQRIVPFTDVEGAGKSFVRAVTGESVRGSWWGHAKGNEIFNLAGAVSRDAVSVKLLAGKETLVHRSLWPALVRAASDPAWRRVRVAALSRGARKLLAAVEKKGEVRLDELASRWKLETKEERRDLAKGRLELEQALLVSMDEVHTEKGSHASRLRTWSRWATSEVREAASRLSLEEALALLERDTGGAPSALDSLAGRPAGKPAKPPKRAE
ncbi:hypothetical protein HY251_09480 [bacterium]|nr:hypothetical protein [bacterium]